MSWDGLSNWNGLPNWDGPRNSVFTTQPTRYQCSIRGRCDLSHSGLYESKEECEVTCRGAENADLIYLILSYDWWSAINAASSDKQELVRREFGLTVSPNEAETILSLLANKEFGKLLEASPVFEEYVFSHLTPFSTMLLEAMLLDSPGRGIFGWKRYEETLRRKVKMDLRNYDPRNFSLDALAYNLGGQIASVLANYTRRRSYSTSDKIRELVAGYLPALIEEFVPERWDELYS